MTPKGGKEDTIGVEETLFVLATAAATPVRSVRCRLDVAGSLRAALCKAVCSRGSGAAAQARGQLPRTMT